MFCTIDSYATEIVTPEGLYCPRVFDGFACWNETRAGTTVHQPCPSIVIGFDSRRLAHKRCTEYGRWEVNPDTNETWSDYTDCVDLEDLTFRKIVNNIYIYGYKISTVAVTISMILLQYLRSLRCPRTLIHKHLYGSYVVNNVIWILWYKLVIEKVEVVQQNNLWCQLLHILTMYGMEANYMWMFAEGLHLFLILNVVSYISDNTNFDIFLTPWFSIFNKNLLIIFNHTNYALSLCWLEYHDSYWFITVPVLLSLVISFVQLSGLHAEPLRFLHPVESPRRQGGKRRIVVDSGRVRYHIGRENIRPRPVWLSTRSVAQSKDNVVPLFGLHYIFYPIRPAPGSTLEIVYEISVALLTSTQGLLVAILFCFMNNDVQTALKAKLGRRIEREDNGDIPMAGITVRDSEANTRDNSE
ncbi:calcitonin gene-related peptide type 1 receptor-like [Papilio machaon]|uniref:calcitonin gene-related peptide type 1 receptor-like n=1 Tax=Papilio machaon TaxID=76193 RepID=UPI001E663713|nr:calcitonin gene-related peptide type 1 receptor-like [Papilio machaon]